MRSLLRPLRKPLTLVYTQLNRESFLKFMFLVILTLILVQVTISSVLTIVSGHRHSGFFRIWNHNTAHKVPVSSESSIVPVSTIDQDSFSAFTRENTVLSAIRSSNGEEMDGLSAVSNDHYKQYSAKDIKNPNESQPRQSLQHMPKYTTSVIDNVYPRPGKHKKRKIKERSIFDVSDAKKKRHRSTSSNEVIPSDKIETYKKNLTALLHEIKLPTTTPEYDIVSPGSASAEEQKMSQVPNGKPLCPAVPPDLEGPLYVSFVMPTMSRIEAKFPDVVDGRWAPKDCSPLHKVAIIIPYRDRDEHLRIFLNYMHSFLQKQLIDYGIYVVEQFGKSRFNRAMLMNIGFKEAGKLYENQCYIFHDVDLLPEDDRNLYSCPTQPRHMSVAVDTMSYKLPYATIFGGVVAFKKEHFQKVNGFSNCFFGWGGEDDDLYNRFKDRGYRLKRYPTRIARYRMITHLKEYPSPDRYTYLNTGSDRYKVDGINSLKYKLLKVEKHKLFTKFIVDINETEVMSDFQVTEMPPGLFDLEYPQGGADDLSWFDKVADETGAKTKTESHYTIVKQSDILRLVQNLKKKNQNEGQANGNSVNLPDLPIREV